MSVGASGLETVKCYKCGQLGHKKPMCPQLKKTLTTMCYVPQEMVPETSLSVPSPILRTIELNGKKVTDLIDTDCMQTLVDSECFPQLCALSDSPIIVKCVHGEERPYPVTDIYLAIGDQAYLMRLGLAGGLPYPVILGHDFLILTNLLSLSNVRDVDLVLTQSQSKLKESEDNPVAFLPFYGVELPVKQGKKKKSKREKRREKFKGTVGQGFETNETEKLVHGDQFLIPGDLRPLQKQDFEISKLYCRGSTEWVNCHGVLGNFFMCN